MKNRLKLLVWLFALSGPLAAQSVSVNGPDGKLQLTVSCPSANGEVSYAVTYNGKQMLESSPLGMETNVGDFYRGLQLKEHKVTAFDTVYEQSRSKLRASITGQTNCFVHSSTVRGRMCR